jgi:hypothetical protein
VQPSVRPPALRRIVTPSPLPSHNYLNTRHKPKRLTHGYYTKEVDEETMEGGAADDGRFVVNQILKSTIKRINVRGPTHRLHYCNCNCLHDVKRNLQEGKNRSVRYGETISRPGFVLAVLRRFSSDDDPHRAATTSAKTAHCDIWLVIAAAPWNNEIAEHLRKSPQRASCTHETLYQLR